MDDRFLCQLGLSENQARAYRALVLRKHLQPIQLMKLISETRANCYAILNKLVEMGLARKEDENKKLVYYPESPVVLESMLAQRVADEQSRLASLQRRLPQMISAFSADDGRPQVETYEGRQQIEVMYEQQAIPGTSKLQFIHSRADISLMGVPVMKKLRYLAVKNGIRRNAISVFNKAFYNPIKDRQSKLKRTWISPGAYSSPVEWSVRGDNLQIICFDGKGYGVSITHPIIAKSFSELFGMLDGSLRRTPNYPSEEELGKDSDVERMQKWADDERQNYL